MENKNIDELLILLFIATLYISIHLLTFTNSPLLRDETFYAEMVEGCCEYEGIWPTAYEMPALWKPPVFFWVYSPIVSLLKEIDILPLEAVYRIPTMFFGLVNIFLVFFVLKNIIKEKEILYLTTLTYSLMPFVIHTDNKVLVDSLAYTFILLGLLFYFRRDWKDWRFIVGGIFVFLAFMTKLLIAAMIPILAVAYLYFKDKKTLVRPLFLISLLALPIAMVYHHSLFTDEKTYEGIAAFDVGDKLTYLLSEKKISAKFVLSFLALVMLVNIWIFLAIIGLYKMWKKDYFMTFWFLLIIVVYLASGSIFWYYLPIAPAIAYFAVMGLAVDKNRLKIDKLFVLMFMMAIMISTISSAFYFWQLQNEGAEQKEIGRFMASKENVMFIGNVRQTAVAYKVLTERREMDYYYDFGWIIMPSNSSDEILIGFIENYHRDDIELNDGDIHRIYWHHDEIFRKKTEINHFDYIVLAGFENVSITNGNSIYDGKTMRVFKMPKETSPEADSKTLKVLQED